MSILTVILIAYAVITSVLFIWFYGTLLGMMRKLPNANANILAHLYAITASTWTAVKWPFGLIRVTREIIQDHRDAKAQGISIRELTRQLKEADAQQWKEEQRLSQLTSYQRWAEENGVA